MKTLATMAIALLMIAGFANETQAQRKGEKTVVIEASMTCGQCKAKIEKDIAFERGVKAVEANHETKMVTIRYQDNRTSEEKLVQAIEKLGYKAKLVDPNKCGDKTTKKSDCNKKEDMDFCCRKG